MFRDLSYVRAVVEVSAGLPMQVQVSPDTGLLELRLGRGCPVVLTMDRQGRDRLATFLDLGRQQQEKAGIEEPEGWAGRFRWQDRE